MNVLGYDQPSNSPVFGHTLDIEFVVYGDWHTPALSLDEERTQARSDALKFASSYDATHQRLHHVLEEATRAKIVRLPVGLGNSQSEDGSNYCQIISVELSSVSISGNRTLADVWTSEAVTRLNTLFQRFSLLSEVNLVMQAD